MARVTRQTLREADPTYIWKLVLRTLSIIVAAVAIGLIAWAEIHTVIPVYEPDSVNSNSLDYYGGDGAYYADNNTTNWTLPWEFISLGLSIVWNLTNIGIWFTPSRSGRGIHPGVNVGCDLVLWLILLLTGIFAAFGADTYISHNINNYYTDGYYDYNNGGLDVNGTHYSILPNGTTYSDPNQCAPFLNCDAQTAYGNQLTHKGVVIAVGIAFTFIAMLFHFALFISACRYTHARRYPSGERYAKAITAEATVIAAKMVRDMGFAPPPQWQQQQQQQQQQQGSPTQQPYTLPPMTGAISPPAEGEMQQRHEPQAMAAQPELNRNGKGKERDLERGQGPLGDIASSAATASGSSGGPPHINVESPSADSKDVIR